MNHLQKKFGEKALRWSPPCSFNEKQGKGLSQQLEVTRCVGDCKISRLLFVLDHTTGIRFLVDSGAQISIIPAKKEDKKRGLRKFTLQAVNKSLIQTYDQKCLTLNLGLKRGFTHIFVTADMEKAILGADFLHKYGLFVDIKKRCLTDPLTKVKSSGSVRKGILLCPSEAKTEENPSFCKLLKN